MCGIFAFTGPTGPDPAVLAEAAQGAAQRGPHGHGWAGPGTTPHRRLGPMDTATLAGITGPQVVGHARLATIGAYNDPDALQPVTRDGHWVVHNGTVTNYRDLSPGARTDTAAVADVYAHHRRHGTPPDTALELAVKQARHHAWVMVVLDVTGVLVAHRHGLPLWRADHSTGTYLSSRPFTSIASRPAAADFLLAVAPAAALHTTTI